MIAAILLWTIDPGKFAITMIRMTIVVLGAHSPTTIGAFALIIAADTLVILNRSIPLFKNAMKKRSGR